MAQLARFVGSLAVFVVFLLIVPIVSADEAHSAPRVRAEIGLGRLADHGDVIDLADGLPRLSCAGVERLVVHVSKTMAAGACSLGWTAELDREGRWPSGVQLEAVIRGDGDDAIRFAGHLEARPLEAEEMPASVPSAGGREPSELSGQIEIPRRLWQAIEGAGEPRLELSIRSTAPARPGTAETGSEAADALGAFRALHRPKRMRTIVAMVPDPIETTFARELDLLLGAMRDAAEGCGYSFDRQILLWSDDDNGRHRLEPGLMLFRPPWQAIEDRAHCGAEPEVPLAILLVGESPASGVHPAALGEALRLAVDGTCDNRVQMIGPTFSGSRDALGSALRNWSESSPLVVELVSGSATVATNEGFFEGASSETLRITYRTTEVVDKETWPWVRRFLDRRLTIEPERTALLVESSLYGDEIVGRLDAQEDGSEEGERMEIVRFPVHVAQMRADDAKREQSKKPADSAPGSILSGLDLGALAPRPAWRAMGPELTTPSEGLVLAELLRDVVDHRVEAVGVVATDVRDKIFLAREVRKQAPNVRLFTLEADVLLAHPEVADLTRGMLVASSHVLGAGPPGVCRRSSQAEGVEVSRRFGNDWSYGVFQATCELLARERADEPVCPWMSIVGRGALLPIGSGCDEMEPAETGSDGSVVARVLGWLRDHLLTGTAEAGQDLPPDGSEEGIGQGGEGAAAASPAETIVQQDRRWRPPHSWTILLFIATCLTLIACAVVASPREVSRFGRPGWRCLLALEAPRPDREPRLQLFRLMFAMVPAIASTLL